MATVNLGELVTTTLRKRSPGTADNISRNNAVSARLRSKGNVRTVDGGRDIVEPLLVAENQTFQWYSGPETLNTTLNTVVDAANFDWKQAATNVTWSGLEMRIQNAGREQQINLLEARMKVAEITMANNIALSIYSNGTGYAGRELTGLALAIARTNTSGTYGGINRATYAFWQNQSSGDVANLEASAALLESEMQDMWLQCVVGTQKPDLIVTGQVLYREFWSRLSDIQRVTTPESATFGYASLKFVTADVVFDGDTMVAAGIAEANPSMFFINTDTLFFKAHVNTNFTSLDQRESLNQDASVVPMVFAGNITCNNARLNGVVYT